MLVAMDYFTKWTKTVPLKNMTHKEVIEFIIEQIIHRFGIPQTLTIDQGTSFEFKEVREFAELYKIKLLNSSPYYAQANDQAESSNKTLIKFCLKLYGHIAFQGMVLQKLLLLSWYMVKRLCYLSR